jgi:hypothetical protein
VVREPCLQYGPQVCISCRGHMKSGVSSMMEKMPLLYHIPIGAFLECSTSSPPPERRGVLVDIPVDYLHSQSNLDSDMVTHSAFKQSRAYVMNRKLELEALWTDQNAWLHKRHRHQAGGVDHLMRTEPLLSNPQDFGCRTNKYMRCHLHGG